MTNVDDGNNKTVQAEAGDYRLVETTKDLKQATDEFATELAHTLRELRTLSARSMGRVVSAFMKLPIIEVDFGSLQSMQEHRVLMALVKLQDTKTLLLAALDEPPPVQDKANSATERTGDGEAA